MVVNVQLHTILQRETAEGMVRNLDVELAPNSTIGELLELLEIELSSEMLLLVVNGRLREVNYILKPDDRVDLIPALSGGCSRRVQGGY